MKRKKGLDFDPLKDPIKPVVNKEDSTMTADGTSLGADDGIGVGIIMGVVRGKMDHGPLRIIFTTDEEGEFRGAKAIKAEDLEGIRYFLNIDSEKSGAVTIGSASFANMTALDRPETVTPDYDATYTIEIGGLRGGHSGIDIGDGRCNGITALCSLLEDMQKELPFGIVSIKGGQCACSKDSGDI